MANAALARGHGGGAGRGLHVAVCGLACLAAGAGRRMHGVGARVSAGRRAALAQRLAGRVAGPRAGAVDARRDGGGAGLLLSVAVGVRARVAAGAGLLRDGVLLGAGAGRRAAHSLGDAVARVGKGARAVHAGRHGRSAVAGLNVPVGNGARQAAGAGRRVHLVGARLGSGVASAHALGLARAPRAVAALAGHARGHGRRARNLLRGAGSHGASGAAGALGLAHLVGAGLLAGIAAAHAVGHAGARVDPRANAAVLGARLGAGLSLGLVVGKGAGRAVVRGGDLHRVVARLRTLGAARSRAGSPGTPRSNTVGRERGGKEKGQDHKNFHGGSRNWAG